MSLVMLGVAIILIAVAICYGSLAFIDYILNKYYNDDQGGE